MDVGKLFKLPSLPSSAVNKRKAGLPADMAPVLGEDVPKRPRVEDAEDGADVDEDVGEDVDVGGADSDVDSGDEGRFFGGGLTDEQKHILAIMNEDDDAAVRVRTC